VPYVVIEHGPEGNRLDARPYLERLPGFVGDLPPGARAFATDPDHYDLSGKRCVKDLTLGHQVVKLGAKGGTIKFRHSCWKRPDEPDRPS
jgi:hypothetical protein